MERKKKQQCQRNLWRRRRDRYKCMHTEVFFSMEYDMGEGKRIFLSFSGAYSYSVTSPEGKTPSRSSIVPPFFFSPSKFFNQRLVDLSQFVSLFFLAVGCSWLCLSPICREFSFLPQWTILVHRRIQHKNE